MATVSLSSESPPSNKHTLIVLSPFIMNGSCALCIDLRKWRGRYHGMHSRNDNAIIKFNYTYHNTKAGKHKQQMSFHVESSIGRCMSSITGVFLPTILAHFIYCIYIYICIKTLIGAHAPVTSGRNYREKSENFNETKCEIV